MKCDPSPHTSPIKGIPLPQSSPKRMFAQFLVLGYSAGENVANADSKCLGKLQVKGVKDGFVEIVGEQYITPGTKVVGDAVTLPLAPRTSGSANRNGARVYFADECLAAEYDPALYSAWKLWNKTISFDVDLSGVACGCNFAFYLTSLRYSANAGRQGQGSWYCDAQPTAGSVCPEMDLMGAHLCPATHSSPRSCELTVLACFLGSPPRRAGPPRAGSRQRGKCIHGHTYDPKPRQLEASDAGLRKHAEWLTSALSGSRRGRGQQARLAYDGT